MRKGLWSVKNDELSPNILSPVTMDQFLTGLVLTVHIFRAVGVQHCELVDVVSTILDSRVVLITIAIVL